ncbi:MAG: hypothetical protein CMJ34_08605 [Phycisphaerae bacterium]|nr:hypothetical protein [Phycisphaerae bacterium]
MMNQTKTAIGASAILTLAAAASADITGAYTFNYSVTAADFDGSDVTVNVQDLYLSSNDSNDTVLNVFNYNASSTAATSYFQSFTGTGWQPTNLGGPFDTPALRAADSFVTIGGFAQDTLAPEQAPGSGAGSGLDPNFGGNGAAAPGADAGWYNGSPPSLNGQVGSVPDFGGNLTGLGVLIGRFASIGDSDLSFSTLEVTWNQGLGTPGQQGSFTVNVPGPGAIALLGVAGFITRGRRRSA